MRSIKKILVTSFLLVLLGTFLFIPKSAFSFCRAENAVKDSAQALSIGIDLIRDNNWANFPELGGDSHYFLALANTEPDCCRAGGGGFSWDDMTWVWGIDIEVKNRTPGALVSLSIDHCGNPLWHGKMLN